MDKFLVTELSCIFATLVTLSRKVSSWQTHQNSSAWKGRSPCRAAVEGPPHRMARNLCPTATGSASLSGNSEFRHEQMSEPIKSGGELFIVDNGDESWKGLKYLQDWTDIASSFDIATGFFEIGSLLALDGKWQKLDAIQIGRASCRERVYISGGAGS